VRPASRLLSGSASITARYDFVPVP
jgi:hypothetical protein